MCTFILNFISYFRFNNMAKIPRTLQQIKAQWGIIKMFEKRKKFNEGKEISQTGSAPPPASESPSEEDIAMWLPHEFSTDSNEFSPKNQVHKHKDTRTSTKVTHKLNILF